MDILKTPIPQSVMDSLDDYINNLVQLRQATETFAGVAELATQAETNTGTDDLRIVTPLKLKTNYTSKISDDTQAQNAGDASFDPDNLNDTNIITPRKWRLAIAKFILCSWNFAEKITFSKGIVLTEEASHLSPSSDGEIWCTENTLKARLNSINENIITTANVSTDNGNGIIKLSTTASAISGSDNDSAITPLVLKSILLNPSSFASGLFSATLNEISGTITYTGEITGFSNAIFTLNNTLVNSSTSIEWFINGLGFQLINCSYYATSSQITFFVYNTGGTTATQFKIQYRIINL